MKKDLLIANVESDILRAKVYIQGNGDLILNKMNRRTAQDLIDARSERTKSNEPANMWEDIITSIHWKKSTLPENRMDYDEKLLKKLLKDDAPCITGFGLKKSFNSAVVRNNWDKYSTKFNDTVNVTESLIPIKFTDYRIEEKLMQPKKGAPVLTRQNIFSGWSAVIDIEYLETNYSIEQIANIINLAGFGGGIGSGRSSGYGRYHVVDVQAA